MPSSHTYATTAFRSASSLALIIAISFYLTSQLPSLQLSIYTSTRWKFIKPWFGLYDSPHKSGFPSLMQRNLNSSCNIKALVIMIWSLPASFALSLISCPLISDNLSGSMLSCYHALFRTLPVTHVHIQNPLIFQTPTQWRYSLYWQVRGKPVGNWGEDVRSHPKASRKVSHQPV